MDGIVKSCKGSYVSFTAAYKYGDSPTIPHCRCVYNMGLIFMAQNIASQTKHVAIDTS